MKQAPVIPPRLRGRWEDLLRILRDRGSLVLAFSGGVDSSLLLAAAVQALPPEKVLPVLCVGPFTPPWETERARGLAADLGLRLLEVDAAELAAPLIAANDPERCYHCKRLRFSRLCDLAGERGFSVVAEGSQLDDLGDYRPGNRAKEELGIHSPLLEAGLDKSAVRELSRALSLPTAQIPSSACLATRVPTGMALTAPALERIALAEGALRRLLPSQLRLRDHFPMARLELPSATMHLALAEPIRAAIVAALRQAGYTLICLDLEGYRSSGPAAAPTPQ
jgi:uncharacterized protein